MEIAKGQMMRKFIMKTIAQHKIVNISTFWAVKTEHLPKRYTKRGSTYKEVLCRCGADR